MAQINKPTNQKETHRRREQTCVCQGAGEVWIESLVLAVLCLVAQSCPTLCDPMDCSLPGSSVHGDSPGKNAGVGCHALLQGLFPTQGLNPGLPHCRWILYQLSHKGSPEPQGKSQGSYQGSPLLNTKFTGLSLACWTSAFRVSLRVLFFSFLGIIHGDEASLISLLRKEKRGKKEH